MIEDFEGLLQQLATLQHLGCYSSVPPVKEFRIGNNKSESEISPPLKFQNFRIAVTYNHLWLLKHKFLGSVGLSLDLHDVSIFCLETYLSGIPHLYILPMACLKLERPAFPVHILWCKPNIYDQNLSEKVSLMLADSFLIQFLCDLQHISLYFIHKNMKNTWKQLIPASSSHVFKNNSRCFGPVGKFQHTIETLVDRLRFQIISPFFSTKNQ